MQLDLLSTPPDTTLTVADIDEWITITRNTTNAHCASHYPHEWARLALGELLGEEIPEQRWSTSDLLNMLARARATLTRQGATTPPTEDQP